MRHNPRPLILSLSKVGGDTLRQAQDERMLDYLSAGEQCQHDELGKVFSTHALSLIGTPFRLHGRHPDIGFDCIGLILCAAQMSGVRLDAPTEYSLRTTRPDHYLRWLDQPQLQRIATDAPDICGDIWLVRPAAYQLHLMIYTASGFVHAHAGLRRTVLTPAPSPWPLWRRCRIIHSI